MRATPRAPGKVRAMTTLKQRRCGGWTLIECVVSTVILGVGLVGVVGALTAALVANQNASDRQLATAIAQSTLEQMRSLGFADLTCEYFPESVDGKTLPGLDALHGGKRTVVIDDTWAGSPRLRKAAVTVSWRGRNGTPAEVCLETVITNRSSNSGT